MSGPAYFPKGLGLGDAVRPELERDYHSVLVDRVRERGFEIRVAGAGGETTVRLAEEFGFCYGVERAVDYAYQTRQRFPDRTVYITGEIIHNPGVNERLRTMGIRFLDGSSGAPWRIEDVTGQDVVILPAFGVPVATMQVLESAGATLVDATCGSVLNVWKNVERYARDEFTSVIHGKYAHEETMATASRATACGGHYLIVRTIEETQRVCREIEGPSDAAEFLSRFAPAVSPGFDPRVHLERLGLANQTTMLSSESLEVGRLLGEAMARRHGADEAAARFRSFDTICSATQDRQDSIRRLLERGTDLLIVIGGYNSSNTNALKRITAASVPTFHVEASSALIDARRIRHLPVDRTEEVIAHDWLPGEGDLTVGVTAGASTPNSEIGLVIERLLRLRGATDEGLRAL